MLESISTWRAARAPSLAVLFVVASAVTAFAQSTGSMHSFQVPITQDTSGRGPAIRYFGQATIASRRVVDREGGGKDQLLLTFDMSGVTAGAGAATFTTAYREDFTKPHTRAQKVEFVFPVGIEKNEMKLSEVLTAIARFTLDVDTATGAILSATATVEPRP